jgi:hypothetical protein
MQYQIKLVPDKSPNVDGTWVNVPDPPPKGATWLEMETFYKVSIPDGYHMVAYQSASDGHLRSGTISSDEMYHGK